MAYAIYLIEQIGNNTEYVELDCEGVDMTAFFTVSDIEDISKRSDNFTKQITFKGTKRNVEAFGSFPNLNKISDFSLQNRIGPNYNPLRLCDCLIYENGEVLIRGSLSIHSVKIKDGVSYYETSIKGFFIGFAEFIADKKLEDLDMTDLKHRYTTSVMRQSWNTSVEKFNKQTNTYFNQAFQKGKGYVYPYIDYGEVFRSQEANQNRHKPNVHLRNFRPAIYVREYFDRIFSQEGLSGYTYEIKGSDFLKDMFNSLIVPNNLETMTEKASDKNFVLTKTVADVSDYEVSTWFDGVKQREFPVSFQAGLSSNQSENMVSPYHNYKGKTNTIFNVNRTFTCDGKMRVKFSQIRNITLKTIRVSVQLCKRKQVASNQAEWMDPTSWEVIGSSFFRLPHSTSYTFNKVVEFDIGEVKYEEGDQLFTRVLLDEGLFDFTFVNFTVSEATLNLPKVTSTGVMTYNVAHGSPLIPKAPGDIKQLDFIKSIVNVFNFYVYSDRLRPRHMIFETYDDFYSLAQMHVAPKVALDWSHKIDTGKVKTFQSNLSIPKKYLFTFKDETDYANKDHKDSFNTSFGSFSFTDELGITDQKKVELIFSPSPLIEYANTGKVHPAIYTGNPTVPKVAKSNIRLLFYNGLKQGELYNIAVDTQDANLVSGVSVIEKGIQYYPNCGEYLIAPGLTNMDYQFVLQFGRPMRSYFGSDEDSENAPNIYNTFFINQVTQMTNPDVLFVELEVMLNESDIQNLDLRVPVFIDLEQFGMSYFKVLSVDYKSSIYPAIVRLQKIPL